MTAHVHHPAPQGGPSIDLGWLLPGVPAVLLVALYVVLVARRRRAMVRRWSRLRTAAWVTGVVLAAASVSPPVAELARADARGHMVQHLVLGMYAPLGLVLAAPVTLLLGASSTAARRRLGAVLRCFPVRVLSHPVVAGTVSVGGLYAFYLTGLYAATMSSTPLQVVVNVHFLLAGTLFTWAVAGPEPVRRRPRLRVRVVALALAAAAHAYLAKTLYVDAGVRPPGSRHTVVEMEQAAQAMYYGGDLAEVALAVALFAAWYRTRGREASALSSGQAVSVKPAGTELHPSPRGLRPPS